MTLDLRPKWLNVTRSLQKAACKNNGIAVVSANIVVDNSGDPITWTEPNIQRLGPLSSQDDLIRLLAAHSASPENSYHILVAQVLDAHHIAINKGSNDGIIASDWFVFPVDNSRPYAILAVNELRERITILHTIWVDGERKDVSMKGNPIHRIRW